MNFLISFGICSILKLSKQVIVLSLLYKATESVPMDLYHEFMHDLLHTPHPIF